MDSGPSRRIWLTVGASLAVSGGFAIVISLPEGGLLLWCGVAMVATGSLALRVSLNTSDDSDASETTAQESSAPPGARASIEPELLDAVPRRVEMTPRGKLVVAAWMLTLAAYGTLAQKHFHLLPPIPQQDVLEAEGATSTATVHSIESRELEDGRVLHFVGYSFTTESGAPVRINRSIPERIQTAIYEGMRTEVVYFPGGPELHYLPELTSPVSTRIVFFAGGILLAAAGYAEAQRRLHRRLVVRGVAVPGFTASVRRRGGVRSFQVNFDIAGERRSIKASERNLHLRNGQSATVLYDPAAVGRAIVYRLALYRAVAAPLG